MASRGKKTTRTGSSDRADAAKHLALLIRNAQGSARCVYKPGRAPSWWPPSVPFVAVSKLPSSQIEDALAAANKAQTGDNGDRAAKSEGTAALAEAQANSSPTDNPVLLASPKKEHVDLVSPGLPDSYAVDGEGDEAEGVVDDGGKNVVDDDADLDMPPPAQPTRRRAAQGQAAPSERSGRKPADATTERAAWVDEAGAALPSSAAQDDSPDCDAEVTYSAAGDEMDADDANAEDNVDEFLPPRSPVPKWPAVQSQAIIGGGSTLKTADAAKEQARSVAAGTLSKAACGPPRASGESTVYPTDEELDAIVEDAERITQAALDELAITHTLHKRSMIALLQSCCDDIMEKAQLINQRMPRHIREMPAEEYILKYGGDPAAVMEHEIFRRWHEHMETLNAAVAPASASAAADENASPNRLPQPPGSVRARADNAATTARRGTAVAATPNAGERGGRCEGPVRRSARRRAAGLMGMATVGRVATQAETERFRRRGGVVKAVAVRPARPTDVLLPNMATTANGTPVERVAPAAGELGEISNDEGEEVGEDLSFAAKFAAERRRTEALRRENETLKKRLAQPGRNRDMTSVRKLR
jgi:hypothetical protein